MNTEWMNLQYLSYALEVERAGSISKAAENLYMNQPNLSKAIKELETMIGVPLFERTTKGISAITEDGRVFLEYAKNILAQFKDMKSYFQKATPARSFFRISIPCASYIAEAFSLFTNKIDDKEGFYIVLQETNFFGAVNSVVDDGYNFAVTRYRTLYEKFFLSFILEKELGYREILKSEGVIIISAKNRLADKSVLEISDLENMIEITNDDFAIPRQLQFEKLKSDAAPHSKKQIAVYERGSQFDLLAHNPNTFMWVSPMPKNLLIRNSLIQKKCNADNMEFKDMIIYRKGHNFSEIEETFLEILENVKDNIIIA